MLVQNAQLVFILFLQFSGFHCIQFNAYFSTLFYNSSGDLPLTVICCNGYLVSSYLCMLAAIILKGVFRINSLLLLKIGQY